MINCRNPANVAKRPSDEQSLWTINIPKKSNNQLTTFSNEGVKSFHNSSIRDNDNAQSIYIRNQDIAAPYTALIEAV